MACDQQTLMLLSRYANGEANPEETVRASAHLGNCPECRQVVEEWHGQRQILKWAYTVELPEEVQIEEIRRLAGEDKEMAATGAGKLSRIRLGFMPRWNLARVGAIAALFILAAVTYHYVYTPPMLNIGTQMATNIHSTTVRMEGNVRLKFGPDTIARRIDVRSVQLDKGWIDASVRHGGDFRILTRRMEVLDRGTRFQVGTGAKLDYVIVEEGSVSVSKGNTRHQVDAGHILIAQDNGAPVVASLSKANTKNRNSGTPLDQVGESIFVPSSARELDWIAGLRQLASRFPNARIGGGRSYGYDEETGMDYRCQFDKCPNYLNGLREHFTDIAKAVSGGHLDSEEWELPIGVIMVDGILSTPELPADTYYVRLVSENDTLKWRVSGSLGNDADLPFALGKPRGFVGGGSTSGMDGTVDWTLARNAGKHELTLSLSDWPGELKPMLSIPLRGIRTSEARKDDQAMLGEVHRLFPITRDFKMQPMSTLLYLDTERKHRLLIAWNSEAGKQLCRVPEFTKQGREISVIIGAVATDLPIEEPSLQPGVYLMKFVQSALSGNAHIELVTQDGKSVGMLAEPQAVRVNNRNRDSNGENSTSFQVPRGYDPVRPIFVTHPADESAFPMGFKVRGDYQSNVWAEGWIRIKQP